MSKVGILTDSNSAITVELSKKMGVEVLPMPFYIDGEMYLEGITLTQEEFYKRLEENADISTSQPSPGEITDKWDEMLKTYDEIVFIPMSSGLSGTCQTATMLAEDYNGKVCVVNNQRISVTQRQSVADARAMADKGYSAAKIKSVLEREKMESSIYITLETLKYLKKGGRITPAAAAIGTILNLKPVLQIQGEKLDAFTKTRGKNLARKAMIKAMKDDFEKRFAAAAAEGKMYLEIAYSGNREEAEDWKKEVEESFPGYDIIMDPLSLSVACHIGPGALAIACSKHVPEAE